MFKIEYKLDPKYIEKISQLNEKDIKSEDWLEGSFTFQIGVKTYSPPHCDPDGVLMWIGFLPVNEAGLIPEFYEDVWGSQYYMSYRDNIFKLDYIEEEFNEKKIFEIKIPPDILTKSFKNMIVDLHNKLLKINPFFRKNEGFQLSMKTYSLMMDEAGQAANLVEPSNNKIKLKKLNSTSYEISINDYRSVIDLIEKVQSITKSSLFYFSEINRESKTNLERLILKEKHEFVVKKSILHNRHLHGILLEEDGKKILYHLDLFMGVLLSRLSWYYNSLIFTNSMETAKDIVINCIKPNGHIKNFALNTYLDASIVISNNKRMGNKLYLFTKNHKLIETLTNK